MYSYLGDLLLKVAALLYGDGVRLLGERLSHFSEVAVVVVLVADLTRTEQFVKYGFLIKNQFRFFFQIYSINQISTSVLNISM